METIYPAMLARADGERFAYREYITPDVAHLDLLTYGTYVLGPGVTSGELCHANEEALLFCLSDALTVRLGDTAYAMKHFDMLYIPLGKPYFVTNTAGTPGLAALCRAKARNVHPVFFSSWAAVSKDEKRIRHLKQKEVYLMFDVSESADRLIAGYTVYEPRTRAFPPHNHTDQEEIYIFVKGKGSMEVYPDEESKTFVHSVNTMDAVAIPRLNYHPVFSQEEGLTFIWCIAGERYWVGDKHPSFMKGNKK